MDGEWEPPLINNPKCALSGCGPWKAPLIDNPKYKGKWKVPLISNPNYQGKWTPRKIPNPDYFEDLNPYKMQPIDKVAFELWTISDGIIFDNILITDDESIANSIIESTYQIKKEIIDEKTDSWFTSMIKITNKRPWLWAVYLVSIAVPLVLFIGYCCVTPGSKGTTKRSTNIPSSGEASGDEREVTEEEGLEEERDEEKESLSKSEGEEGEEEMSGDQSDASNKLRRRKVRTRKE